MSKLVQCIIGWAMAFFGACLAVSAVVSIEKHRVLDQGDLAIGCAGLVLLAGGCLVMWLCADD